MKPNHGLICQSSIRITTNIHPQSENDKISMPIKERIDLFQKAVVLAIDKLGEVTHFIDEIKIKFPSDEDGAIYAWPSVVVLFSVCGVSFTTGTIVFKDQQHYNQVEISKRIEEKVQRALLNNARRAHELGDKIEKMLGTKIEE